MMIVDDNTQRRLSILVDELTEQRMITELVFSSDVLKAADTVEVDDFTDPRYRAILSTIRNLQQRAMLIEPYEIDAEMRRVDADNGSCIAEMAGFTLLGWLAASVPSYRGKSVLIEHDMAWLRTLSLRRRNV